MKILVKSIRFPTMKSLVTGLRHRGIRANITKNGIPLTDRSEIAIQEVCIEKGLCVIIEKEGLGSYVFSAIGKKMLTILLLILSFEGYSQYSNFEEYKHFISQDYKFYEICSQYGVPADFAAAKLWQESHGGLTSKAYFGIKSSVPTNIHVKDDFEQHWYYTEHGSIYSALDEFCEKITTGFYMDRYKVWVKYLTSTSEAWSLALQVSFYLNRSYLAYASCDCRDGTIQDCYNIRKNKALQLIQIIHKLEYNKLRERYLKSCYSQYFKQ